MLFRRLMRNPFGAREWGGDRASMAMADIDNRLIREASSVGAALRNSTFGDAAVTVSPSTVHFAFGSAGGKSYLIATNDSETSAMGVVFTLPAATTAKDVSVLYAKLAPA